MDDLQGPFGCAVFGFPGHRYKQGFLCYMSVICYLCNMSNNEPSSQPDHALKHLDKGIERAVLLLRERGIHTVESCEGGAGHAFPEPTVVFSGDKGEGYRALSIALQSGLAVVQLRRVWPVIDYEP